MNAKAFLEKTQASTYRLALSFEGLEEAVKDVRDRFQRLETPDPELLKILDHCEALIKLLDTVDVPEGNRAQDEGKVDPPK